MENKIFIGNLAWSITNDRLAEIFSDFGEVSEAIIIKNDRGLSKGFGFVTFTEEDSVEKAISSLHEKEVEGRNIIVSKARPKQ
jgi:RNA recognition motif-containing protein